MMKRVSEHNLKPDSKLLLNLHSAHFENGLLIVESPSPRWGSSDEDKEFLKCPECTDNAFQVCIRCDQCRADEETSPRGQPL